MDGLRRLGPECLEPSPRNGPTLVGRRPVGLVRHIDRPKGGVAAVPRHERDEVIGDVRIDIRVRIDPVYPTLIGGIRVFKMIERYERRHDVDIAVCGNGEKIVEIGPMGRCSPRNVTGGIDVDPHLPRTRDPNA